jgi:hypothetical protein
MLLMVLLICVSVCGCPECFYWSRSLSCGDQTSWPFVVDVSVMSAVLIPRMRRRIVCCYLVFVSCNTLNIGLYVCVIYLCHSFASYLCCSCICGIFLHVCFPFLCVDGHSAAR